MRKLKGKPSPEKLKHYSKHAIAEYIFERYSFTNKEIDAIITHFKLEDGMDVTKSQLKRRIEGMLLAWLRHSQTNYEDTLTGDESFSDYYFKRGIFIAQAHKLLDRYRKK